VPATFISRPSSVTDRVLRRSEYAKDRNGLETITEIYTIRSAARISIQPATGARHSVYSHSSVSFARMVVESVSFREIDGDLAEMTVTYVGLTSTAGLPPAIVSISPSTGSGVYGPDAVVQAEFVSDTSEFSILRGQLSSVSACATGFLSNKLRMPSAINGTAMPPNPREPFRRGGTSGFGTAGSAFSVYSTLTIYEGYVLGEISCVRRGLFTVANTSFAEFFSFQISQ